MQPACAYMHAQRCMMKCMCMKGRCINFVVPRWLSYLEGCPIWLGVMTAAGSQSGGVTSWKVSWITLHFSRRSDCVVADNEGLAFTCIH